MPSIAWGIREPRPAWSSRVGMMSGVFRQASEPVPAGDSAGRARCGGYGIVNAGCRPHDSL